MFIVKLLLIRHQLLPLFDHHIRNIKYIKLLPVFDHYTRNDELHQTQEYFKNHGTIWQY